MADIGKELLTIDHWKTAWESNFVPWHENKVEKVLKENLAAITNGKENLKILVPFCGKSLDMIWLVEQGHIVVGVEVVEKPIRDFFTENSIKYAKEEISLDNYGPTPCYSAFEGKLKLFECDFFNFNSCAAGGKVDLIWDRGGLGSIQPCKRNDYVKTVTKLIKEQPHGSILIHTFTYDTKTFSGPPFSVDSQDLKSLFGKTCEVVVLYEEDAGEKKRITPNIKNQKMLYSLVKF